MLYQNKRHAIEGGSRLQEGRTEVTLSMAARGDRKLGATDRGGTLWSEERSEASLTPTSLTGFPFSGHCLHGQHTSLQLRRCGMPNLKYSPLTAIGSTVISHWFLYAFRNTRIAVPALEVDVVLPGEAAYANSCICSRCLFGESRNAYDRS